MGKKDQQNKRGSKKIGRLLKKPAHQRYNLEKRWEINKKKRMAKQAKIEAKKKAKKERLNK